MIQYFGRILFLAIVGLAPVFAGTITEVNNNYGPKLLGQPGFGITPSSIIYIKGPALSATTNTSPLQAFPLPTVLDGVTVDITVGSSTVKLILYYITPNQIAGVVPANTPSGSGTIRVTTNGTVSNAFPITVLKTSLGILTLNGGGWGPLGARDGDFALITESNSATRGGIAYFYGTGLRAFNGSETVQNNAGQDYTDIDVKVYIGGVLQKRLYAGASAFPGLGQIAVEVDRNTPLGCGVGVVILAENIPSNTGSLPVAAQKGACTDPLKFTEFERIRNNPKFRIGNVSFGRAITQVPGPNLNFVDQTTISGNASFVEYTPQTYDTNTYLGNFSLNSCMVGYFRLDNTSIVPRPAVAYLNVGEPIRITGADSSQMTLNRVSPGVYTPGNQPNATFVSQGPATYRTTGPGGPDGGAFSSSLTLSGAFTVTNRASIGNIGRAQGVTINWTNGVPGSYVTMVLLSVGVDGIGEVVCYAPADAGTFTIPAAITLGLPVSSVRTQQGITIPSGSSLTVSNQSVPVLMSVPSIDFAAFSAFFSEQKLVELN
jgi:uncharacterized protein (TIGR03437 family)